MMEPAGDFVFQQKELPYECYEILKDMRKKEEFCDLTIKVGSGSIHAHKVIVAAGIPYFRSLFSQNSGENYRGSISLTDVEPVALEALIDFAYSGEIKITSENVQMLLCATSFLHVECVKNACVKFLIRTASAENAFNLRVLGLRLDCQDLVRKIDDYIKENFDEMSLSEGFLSQPYSYVNEIISEDNLQVTCEEKVFEAVIRWIKESPGERIVELPELLSCVRMPFVKPSYIRDRIAKDALVRDSLKCRDILDDARDYHLFPENRHMVHTWKFLLRPRKYKTSESMSSRFQYWKHTPEVCPFTFNTEVPNVGTTASICKTPNPYDSWDLSNKKAGEAKSSEISSNSKPWESLGIMKFGTSNAESAVEQPKHSSIGERRYAKGRRQQTCKTSKSKVAADFTQASTPPNNTTSDSQLSPKNWNFSVKNYIVSDPVKVGRSKVYAELNTTQPNEEEESFFFLGKETMRIMSNSVEERKLGFSSNLQKGTSSVSWSSLLQQKLKLPADTKCNIAHARYFKLKAQKSAIALANYNNIPLAHVRYHPSIDNTTTEDLVLRLRKLGGSV